MKSRDGILVGVAFVFIANVWAYMGMPVPWGPPAPARPRSPLPEAASTTTPGTPGQPGGGSRPEPSVIPKGIPAPTLGKLVDRPELDNIKVREVPPTEPGEGTPDRPRKTDSPETVKARLTGDAIKSLQERYPIRESGLGDKSTRTEPFRIGR